MGSSLETNTNLTSLQGVLAAEATDDQLSWRWPATPLLAALEEVQLLEFWLQRQLNRLLEQLWHQRQQTDQDRTASSAGSLQHHCFAAEANSLFLQRQRGLEQVLISLLQLDDQQLAQEFWFRLQAGETTFEDLSQHGIGPERDLRGRLGPIAIQDLDATLHPLLMRLKPGELATPLLNPDGTVLLLRLEQRWPAQLDAQTRQQLEQELYDDWRDAQLSALLQQQPAPGSLVTLTLPWRR